MAINFFAGSADHKIVDRGRVDEKTIITSRPFLLERFQVVRMLGKGAAGHVFHAIDLKHGNREVAIKVLHNIAAFDEHTKERFLQEIDICKRIRHPNIVEAYDFIDMPDCICFTMEYVQGRDLAHLLKQNQPLPFGKIDSIFDQLMLAIHELHVNGILHRDIKLENIIIRHDGRIKLTDLGLVKFTNQRGLTKTGTLLGTSQYMPPEYVRNSIYDVRSEIYACGLVLYELLGMKRWLNDKPGPEALEYMLKTNFVIPKLTNTTIPDKYQNILDIALSREPSKRFQTALHMREAFVRNDGSSSYSRSQVIPEDRGMMIFDTKIAENQKRKSFIDYIILGMMLGLLVLWGMQTFLKSAPEIESGKYTGEIVLNPRGEKALMLIRSDDRGLFIKTSVKGCSSGFVDIHTMAINCEGPKFSLKFDRISSDLLKGQMQDGSSGASYPFELRRSLF